MLNCTVQISTFGIPEITVKIFVILIFGYWPKIWKFDDFLYNSYRIEAAHWSTREFENIRPIRPIGRPPLPRRMAPYFSIFLANFPKFWYTAGTPFFKGVHKFCRIFSDGLQKFTRQMGVILKLKDVEMVRPFCLENYWKKIVFWNSIFSIISQTKMPHNF